MALYGPHGLSAGLQLFCRHHPSFIQPLISAFGMGTSRDYRIWQGRKSLGFYRRNSFTLSSCPCSAFTLASFPAISNPYSGRYYPDRLFAQRDGHPMSFPTWQRQTFALSVTISCFISTMMALFTPLLPAAGRRFLWRSIPCI